MKTGTAPQSLFELGEIVITEHARRTLRQSEITKALARHATGNWGTLCEDDRHQNELALDQGLRILSAHGRANQSFWVITDADRSKTTVHLPLDFIADYLSGNPF